MQSEIARELGIHRQRVSGWLSQSDPHLPNAEHALAIVESLPRQKRRAQRSARVGMDMRWGGFIRYKATNVTATVRQL
jgi:hypothetical protein